MPSEKLPSEKLPSDNSAALSSTLHQLYIALEQCFEMDNADQYVVIEKFGDVTSKSPAGDIQIEVKSFSSDDALGDSHANFWKTLKNWLEPKFELSNVKSLVLYTTQPLGLKTRFHEWNDANTEKRVQILRDIVTAAEESYGDIVKKSGAKKIEPSQSLNLMRYALDPQRSSRLKEVVNRLHISAGMLNLSNCYNRLLLKHSKGIPSENRKGYIGALLEFIIRPETIQNNWSIKHSEFSAQMVKFGARFGSGRLTFPRTHFIKESALTNDILEKHQSSMFVEKIREIQFDTKIPSAIADYTSAHRTWLEEFSKHQCLDDDYQIFAQDVRRTIGEAHELASIECTDEISDAKKFYLKMTGGNTLIPTFPNLDQPDIGYRNGVIHELMDIETDLRWRLKK